VSSPLSVGSWVLAASGPLAAGSAALANAAGAAGAVGNLAGGGAGVLGLPLAGYTGVLLTSTTVPLWHGAARSLPVLFEASAVTAAASLLDLMDLDEREARIVRRYGTAGRLAELVAAEALERELGEDETVSRPLQEGASGSLWTASKILTAGSLGLSVLGRRRRWARTGAGILGTAGAIALRFAVFHAGKASARDPRATFHSQRNAAGADPP
jgi:formate-dependent nitrite reductase membrane component NrfD